MRYLKCGEVILINGRGKANGGSPKNIGIHGIKSLLEHPRKGSSALLIYFPLRDGGFPNLTKLNGGGSLSPTTALLSLAVASQHHDLVSLASFQRRRCYDEVAEIDCKANKLPDNTMATTTTTAAGNADPPPPSPSPASSKTGFLKTCFNGGGWSSLAIFLAIAIICCYTGILLQRCMDASPLVTTYPDIGALAFGRRGRLAVTIFMYLELFLVAATTSTSSSRPPGSTAKQGFVLAATLAVLPTTWFSSLGVLAYVAAAGALATVVLVASVMWVAVFDGVGFHERERLVHWAGLPAAVLFICFLVSTLSYGFMGIIGYLMYGDALMSQVTLNLPSGKVSSKIAIYTTLVNPLTKYALVVTPIVRAGSIICGVLVLSRPCPSPRPSRSRVLCVLLRTAIVVATAVVALAVPFFVDVVALTGALLSCTATMLLPSLCFLRVRAKVGPKKLWMETVACVGIVVVGLTESVGVLGLLVAYVPGGTDWFGGRHRINPPYESVALEIQLLPITGGGHQISRWSLASRWKFISKEAPTVSVAIFGGHQISRSLCVSTNG
ncbi:hypothetical protein HU200_036168 [Digitaria exilis]|uniref:Amino acid transporter transmembrane domain-containing protein n=1 Tax=Digitaria exilis TaxID=1010633 RepID=A0A835ENY1_9POAL|nr:hypothetical protein HU200_036168 [Digitaria exilis]